MERGEKAQIWDYIKRMFANSENYFLLGNLNNEFLCFQIYVEIKYKFFFLWVNQIKYKLILNFWELKFYACTFLVGMHVVRGKPSKKFHPFLLPGDMKGSLEELKHKLMVNFDPLRCFVGDVEASIILKKIFFYIQI